MGDRSSRHSVCTFCCHAEFNLCCDFLVGCLAQGHKNDVEKIPLDELEEAREFLRKFHTLRGDTKITHNIFKDATVITTNESSEIF